ncbi:MAG TPA: PGPGW domain-containing protein [Nocardioidaceae bacterium]|nr:PGPGW domain-containing protein [Nocardioidaceae bacterium]
MPDAPVKSGRWSTRKLAVTVVGTVLSLAGIAALVLPGPGLLLLLAGLVVLATEFEWAAKRVDTVRDRAFDVSAAGVATWPRIILSTLGACALVAVGIFWWMDPRIAEIWILGPALPFGGWTTGSVLVLSGLVALGLLVYSIQRFRLDNDEPPGSGSG